MKPDERDTDPLLTIQDAHQRLDGKVSVNTLYIAVQSKALRHYRVSATGKRGKVLIRESDLFAWLQEQCVESSGKREEKPEAPPPMPKLKHLHL